MNAVTNPDSSIVIAAGSEIDYPVPNDELERLDRAGYKASERIYIDAQATILEDRHHDLEAIDKMHERLGSTGKGIGAARADRILRKAKLWGDDNPGSPTDVILRITLNTGGVVRIEGTQGYALGLHAGHYPYCTSSDTRAIDFCAMAGVMPWDVAVDEFEIYVVLRTFPIRVAGNSGPTSGETSWDELGRDPEFTTVTNKVRRVGTWDAPLAREAVRANGGNKHCTVALTMFDYVFPAIYGMTSRDALTTEMLDYIDQVEFDAGAKVSLTELEQLELTATAAGARTWTPAA